jgi:hypothetical protein
MGHATFQNLATDMCRAFMGPHVQADLARLAKLEGGLLTVDFLTAECRVDDARSDELAIGAELKRWFDGELQRTTLRIEDVARADLAVRFSTKPEPVEQRERGQKPGTVVHFECSSLIEAFGREHVARERGQRQID